MRTLLVVLLIVAWQGATRAACLPEDGAADPTSTVAAALEQLEPDLVAGSSLELSPDAHVVLDFLERTNDPAAAGSSPTTEEAVAAAARVYGHAWPAGRDGADGDGGSSRGASADWLEEVGGDLVTQALITTDGRKRRHATFAAVHWPSPLAPRLRVVRIPPELRGVQNREAVLELLGTCAVEVDEWISVPEDVAERFLEENVRAAMLVMARDPRSGAAIERWVEPENLIAALRFEDPRTADLDAFSAWFAGEGPGPLEVTRLLPRLRGSLGPGDLLALYRSLQR